MKVSIVTVCYNSAATIQDTLCSIAIQSYPNIEHVVIDGGSTDGTLDILDRQKEKISTLISEADDGIYDAMNKGLRLATGDVIGFLNADDMFESARVVEEIVQALTSEPTSAGCYGDVKFVSRRNKNIVRRLWRAGIYSDKKLRWGWMPPHPTFYVRREVYQEVGEFKAIYKVQADYDMAIRICYKKSIKLVYLNKIMVVMKFGGASSKSVSSVLRNNIEALKIARENSVNYNWLFVIVKILQKLPQFYKL